MARYKAARPKKTDATPQMRPGVPCLVIVVAAIILVGVVMIIAITHTS